MDNELPSYLLRALRVTEAAQFLDVVPSTAHRLLATLNHHGFVTQEAPGGAYLPGPTLTEVAFATLGGIDIREAARPVLTDIKDATKETVSLMVLEGDQVRFIQSLEGPRSLKVGSRLGAVLPAHCTSAGKSMLALLRPDDLARRYPRRRLRGVSANSIQTWEELVGELDEVRHRGYATNFQEGDAGISGVGACVRDASGGPLAGVAIAAPASRLPTATAAAQLARPLLQGVATIEAKLRV
jgi:DNA-binding IclR family transcriptional regulator